MTYLTSGQSRVERMSLTQTFSLFLSALGREHPIKEIKNKSNMNIRIILIVSLILKISKISSSS